MSGTIGVKQYSVPITGQRGISVAASTTAVQTAQIGTDLTPGTFIEVVICPFDVHIYALTGPNPTATNACAPIAAGSSVRVTVKAGDRVSVLGLGSGTVSVYPEL